MQAKKGLLVEVLWSDIHLLSSLQTTVQTVYVAGRGSGVVQTFLSENVTILVS